jgi:glycosyltransferase involved in cell wall biosynthesis
MKLRKMAAAVLPLQIRRISKSLYHGAAALSSRPAPALDQSVDGPVRIAGFFTSTLGLGEAARQQGGLLASFYTDAVRCDLTGAIIPEREVLGAYDRSSFDPSTAGGGICIFHANPPEMPRALSSMRLRQSVYRIGCWVYELQQPPPEWRLAARLVNEVWAPSKFTADALARVVRRPVHTMPLPMRPFQPSRSIRERLGIGPHQFMVLFAYDCHSSHTRKNPEAAILAFRKAFPAGVDARMIVKVSNLASWKPAARSLASVMDGDTRVTLLTETLSRSEMAGLVQDADAVVSLHRSEGFGLLLAEAMARGRPVIATGWSGNLEFMNADVSLLVPSRLAKVRDPQGVYHLGEWAEADVDAAATLLARCYENPRWREEIGNRARKHVEEYLGPALATRYLNRLHALGIRSQSCKEPQLRPAP